ncbi:MAG: hypothetical protein GF364_20870 [Candidatus Lokiarchaeota archaeon]|nr:hypothetical protein [Candidatus Lokiarchaeota archaeon]
MIGANLRGIDKKSVIVIVEFSIFIDESGPTPIYCHPKIEEEDQMDIAMKSISLLMGEGVYQNGYAYENVKYFGILPFPDINMVGITYFFLIKDPNARGKAKAATLTILVKEKDTNFLYENVKTLRVLLDRTAVKLQNPLPDNKVKEIMEDFREELEHFDLTDPTTNKLIKKMKIIFNGLDNSGKTSFLTNVQQRYSELIGITATKGIQRQQRRLLGTDLLEWDFGGQENYRTNYFKNAEIYLSEVDLMFYIIDIQDEKRIEEAQSYLHQLLTTLDSFKQYPPIIIVFHKFDPDIQTDLDVLERINNYKKHIKDSYTKWVLKFFNTTIFDHWTIISAFSYGIAQLSPNREIFRKHLKWISRKMNASAGLLVAKNSIILSDYSENAVVGKFIELSESNFYNIFLKFEEFDILNDDFVVWEFGNINIVLKKFYIDRKEFFLLLQLKDIESLPKFDGYLSKFKNKIRPLIKNYI